MELSYREFERDNKPFKIPISLELKFDNDTLYYKIDKRQTGVLKRECTRALYFLLTQDGKELFTFEQFSMYK